MEVLIQFDQSGSYQDSTWGTPIPYQKGEIHSVTPLSAIVLIDQHQAHLYRLKHQEERRASIEK